MINPILIAERRQLSNIYNVRGEMIVEEIIAKDKKDYIRASKYNYLAFDLTFQLFAREPTSDEWDILDTLMKRYLDYFFKLNSRGRQRWTLELKKN